MNHRRENVKRESRQIPRQEEESIVQPQTKRNVEANPQGEEEVEVLARKKEDEKEVEVKVKKKN